MSVLRTGGVKSTLASFVEVIIFFCVLTPLFAVICYSGFHLVHGPWSRSKQASDLTERMENAQRAGERQAATDLQRSKIEPKSPLGEELMKLVSQLGKPGENPHEASRLLHRVAELGSRKVRTDLDELKTATEFATEAALEAAELMLADLLEEALLVNTVTKQVSAFANKLHDLGQLHLDALNQARAATDRANLGIALARSKQMLLQAAMATDPAPTTVADAQQVAEQIQQYIDATNDRIAEAEEAIRLAKEAQLQPEPEPTPPADEPVDPDEASDDKVQEQLDKSELAKAVADVDEADALLALLAEQSYLVDLITPLNDDEIAPWWNDLASHTSDRVGSVLQGQVAAQATIDRLKAARPSLVPEATPEEIIVDANATVALAKAQAERVAGLLEVATRIAKAQRDPDDAEWLAAQAEAADQERAAAETDKANAAQTIADLSALAEDLASLVEALDAPKSPAIALATKATVVYEAVRDVTNEGVEAAKAAAAEAGHASDLLKQNRLAAALRIAKASEDLRSRSQNIADLAQTAQQQAAATYDRLAKAADPALKEFVWNIRRAEMAAGKLMRRARVAAGHAADLDRSRAQAGQPFWGSSLGQGLSDIRLGKVLTTRKPYLNVGELFVSMPWWMWMFEGLLYAMFVIAYWSPGEKLLDSCELRGFALFALTVGVVLIAANIGAIAEQVGLILRIATGRA